MRNILIAIVLGGLLGCSMAIAQVTSTATTATVEKGSKDTLAKITITTVNEVTIANLLNIKTVLQNQMDAIDKQIQEAKDLGVIDNSIQSIPVVTATP
jgi:hypothetical protein